MGFIASRISIASDTRTDHNKVARELHTKPSVRNNFGNRVYKRVRFRSWDLWVMGPPCGLKVGRVVTSCTAATGRHVSE